MAFNSFCCKTFFIILLQYDKICDNVNINRKINLEIYMSKKREVVDPSIPKTLPLLLRSRVESIPEVTLQASKNSKGEFEYFSYRQVYEKVIELAWALKQFVINIILTLSQQLII